MKFKILILTFFALAFFIQVNAQESTIGFGPEISFPSGSSSNVSAIGLGGFVKVELGLSDKFALTGQASVVSFFGKRFFGAKTPTLSYLPVKTGLKYYSSSTFYLEGQLGASFPINGETNTSFVWSPGIGTYLNKSDANHKLDIGLRYESWTKTKFNFITLRVGYLFGL
jgi:hypothetical protein